MFKHISKSTTNSLPGGEGTKVGDIVFASKAPDGNFIPINKRRVYKDEFPKLSSVLIETAENDGAEWLRLAPFTDYLSSGSLPTTVTSTNSITPVAGGVVGTENVLVFVGPHSAYIMAGPVTGKTFTTYREFEPFQSTSRPISANLDISDSGTIIARVVDLSSGNGYIGRTIDGGKSWVRSNLTQVGLPSNFSSYPTIKWIDGKRWIIAGDGKIYKTLDDGLNWSPVAEGVRTYYTNGMEYSGSTRWIDIAACGSFVFLLAEGSLYNPNNGYYTKLIHYLNLSNLTYAGDMSPGQGAGISAVSVTVGSGRDGNNFSFLVRAASGNTYDSTTNLAMMTLSGTSPGALIENISLSSTASEYSAYGARIATWDGYSYFYLPNVGLFQKTGTSWQSRKLVSPSVGSFYYETYRNNISKPDARGLITFPTFSIFTGLGQNLSDQNTKIIAASPAASARRYYQFNDAGVVGALRADGKLPYIKAK